VTPANSWKPDIYTNTCLGRKGKSRQPAGSFVSSPFGPGIMTRASGLVWRGDLDCANDVSVELGFDPLPRANHQEIFAAPISIDQPF
jgi:hypothetical protein